MTNEATDILPANKHFVTLRKPIKMLRRWCPVAKTHQDADDPVCGRSDCLGELRPTHRLRKRRMFVCSKCEQGYFTLNSFKRHECYSAY